MLPPLMFMVILAKTPWGQGHQPLEHEIGHPGEFLLGMGGCERRPQVKL